MAHRPEHSGPAELYYNSKEARKYTDNGRIIEVQLSMTERAVELLRLPTDSPQLLLDIGCGSGLSGEYITEQVTAGILFIVQSSLIVHQWANCPKWTGIRLLIMNKPYGLNLTTRVCTL